MINTWLWIAQGLMAAVFVAAGLVKMTQSRAEMAPRMAYVEDFSDGTIKFIGVTEFAGGLGLLLPALTGIATFLTPLAAAGLALTMFLAALVHIRRKEQPLALPNVIFMAALLFIVWGRFGPYAF